MAVTYDVAVVEAVALVLTPTLNNTSTPESVSDQWGLSMAVLMY